MHGTGKLEKLVMFVILTLIVLVASFNIISNLIMIVMEKSREIAIMKAMGANRSGIMSIFMIHGLVIGVVGTVIGLTGGFFVCHLLKTYQVPSAAIFISFMATVYPSWQAARLDPVEPLRYE
jgi:lipoprotein-releasing system permease protein